MTTILKFEISPDASGKALLPLLDLMAKIGERHPTRSSSLDFVVYEGIREARVDASASTERLRPREGSLTSRLTFGVTCGADDPCVLEVERGDGATGRSYVQGSRLCVSYRGASKHALVDEICRIILGDEDAFIGLLDACEAGSITGAAVNDEPDRPIEDEPDRPIEDEPHTETPSIYGEGVETELVSAPLIEGLLCDLGLDVSAARAHRGTHALELEVAREGQRAVLGLALRRSLGLRLRDDGSLRELMILRLDSLAGSPIFGPNRLSPFASGPRVDLFVESLTSPGLDGALLEKLKGALLESEDVLLEEMRDAGLALFGELAPDMLMPLGGYAVVPERARAKMARRPEEGLAMIYLTSPCFANCVFCGDNEVRDYILADVDGVLESIRAGFSGEKRVSISGYEPLSHPGVARMVGECRSVGIERIELMTSGIPLGDPEVIEGLLEAGLTDVSVPVYSHVEANHDLVMRKVGAFEKTARALDALAKTSCRIHVHSVLLAQNVADIDALSDLSRERWGASFVAGAVRSKCRFHLVTPRYSRLAEKVTRAPVVGIPLCLLPRMTEHPDLDLRRPLQASIADMADTMRAYFSQRQEHEPICAGCRYRDACLGMVPEQRDVEEGLTLTAF